MEKLIIILLILIIFLLLSDKFSLKIKREKSQKSLSEPRNSVKESSPSVSVMGQSKYVSPKQETALTQAEEQEILSEFTEESNAYLPDLEDEEEDLRAMRTPEQDNDFATGLSFEELEKVADFLNQHVPITTQNQELAHKLSGTSLLDEIEKALPEASLKVAQLLDAILPQTPQPNGDFDIEEFV